ncbi:hypothetical protein GGX14DRAFT_441140, partial [Mycena pura]
PSPMTVDHLRAELQAWQNALSAHDAGDFRGSLRLFESIANTSKIIVNVALIHDRLGERMEAIQNLTKAIEMDKYLAIGYFQRGVAYYHAGQYEEAVKDFLDAQLMMRTNVEINYDILGLNYHLKLSDILFNKWLSLSRMGNTQESHRALEALQGASPPAELQAMISSAMAKPEESCPCSLPAGTLYRPSATKMRLLESASVNPIEDVKPPSYSSVSPRAETRGRSVTARKCSRKQKSTSTYSGSSSMFCTPRPLNCIATERAELSRAIGPDMMKPMTEIGSTPCAGVRISQGPLSGLMAWRFIVQRDGSNISGASTYAAVVVNFILDTGSQKTYVPADVLAELGYNLKPGSEITLRLQGVRTHCVVSNPEDAGRVGVSFMTAGSLTYYFDAGLVAPVLYDGSHERPVCIPRTIAAVPRRSWLTNLLSIITFSRTR